MSNQFCLGGKILIINLSDKSIKTDWTDQYSDRFLGGIGINLYWLLDGLRREISPFDPENIIALGAGMLVGTLAPTACRLVLNSKNVYTGGFGSASAGGDFSSELKFAGYDNVIITGKASKPVYIYIHDQAVSIEDGSALWGFTTWETEEKIKADINNRSVQVLSIGPAGENLVSSACVVVNRSRAAARCGIGAVMGSKNLKAVAVKGSGGIRVADPEGFVEACKEFTKKILKTKTTQKLRNYGTPISFIKWNNQSALPTLNFQKTQMDFNDAYMLNAEIFKEMHIKKPFGCFSCPIHCSQYLRIHNNKHKNPGEKIECQNLWDFGTKLGLKNLEEIIKLSALCFELGLDINNASGAISWAFECFQRKIITQNDTEGLILNWGDYTVIEILLKKMAYKEGFGALLAKGSCRASEIVGKGSEKFAIHIKGQELAEELRAFKGWALGVTVAERGGTHTMGAPLTERMDLSESLSQELFDVHSASLPDTYEGKAKLVVYYQRFHAVLEALGICFFSSNWMGPQMLGPQDYASMYTLATGKRTNASDLMMYGEKIHNMARLFNLKHTNINRQDDFPPERLFKESATGSNASVKLNYNKWSQMLEEYYELHGWDKKTGKPKKSTFIRLGLSDIS